MTKAQLKYFQSLSMARNRKQERRYLVEGDKSALEWIADARFVMHIIATAEWLSAHAGAVAPFRNRCVEALPHEIAKISTLSTPTQVVVVAGMPEPEAPVLTAGQWYLALDGIRDPGNMGTIIRTADWFGIRDVLVSEDCVETFNPKVVQASMGSLLRVRVTAYADLLQALQQSGRPVYTTHLKGSDIRSSAGIESGIILMGNESRGVGPDFEAISSRLLFIPRVGDAESLNVAVATGIVCSYLILK